ncbi:MAG: hypothetical protein AB7T49_13485 [Oligoflexales bacterium]
MTLRHLVLLFAFTQLGCTHNVMDAYPQYLLNNPDVLMLDEGRMTDGSLINPIEQPALPKGAKCFGAGLLECVIPSISLRKALWTRSYRN